jgi:hypothetical protein
MKVWERLGVSVATGVSIKANSGANLDDGTTSANADADAERVDKAGSLDEQKSKS